MNKQFIEDHLDEFLNLFSKRPIKNNAGGTLAINLFHVFLTLKKYQPKRIIESGVYKGQTTWLINQILPDTKIICLEPATHVIEYRGTNCKYPTTDFLQLTEENISKEVANETLIIFDDHQDSYTRLLHAHKLGFKVIYFDDNYPEFKGNRHLTLEAVLNEKADPGYILPKNGKETLEQIIEKYTIIPPMLPYTEPVTMEKSYITQTPFYQKTSDRLGLDIFAESMHNYRWHTVVELRP